MAGSSSTRGQVKVYPPGARDPSLRVDDACARCGGVDKHPKHHCQDPVTGGLETHHFDCGAIVGCEYCQISEQLTEGRRYDDLVKLKCVSTEAGRRHADELARHTGGSTPRVKGMVLHPDTGEVLDRGDAHDHVAVPARIYLPARS
jgi:hypothetical protein